MSIRRMIPMGTTQRRCVVCGYPINARSAELTAHEMECIEKMTTRATRDPYTGQDVQISDRLVDRLRGKYACGPTLPNGEPEFGWRHHDTPPIQHEAAARIEALEAALRKIAGHDEYSTEDREAAARYKREEGLWTTDEYLADAALAPGPRKNT